MIPAHASLVGMLRIDAETADEDLERNCVFDAVLDARKKSKRLICVPIQTLAPLKATEGAIAALVDEFIDSAWPEIDCDCREVEA